MILYHYCSTFAFHSILQERTVFLSSLTSSNDTHEGRWLTAVLRNVLVRKAAKPSVIAELLRQLSMVERTSIAYGFCLSKRRDMLSQWRGYADDAAGLAIGFKKSTLTKALTEFGAKMRGSPRLMPVAYSEREQAALIERDVEGLLTLLGDATLLPPTLLGSENYEEALARHKSNKQAVTKCISSWWEFIYATKNPAFSEEQEWRVVQEEYLSHIGNSFRVRGSELVPFMKLKFPEEDWKEMIDQVWIGPRNPTSVEVVSDFLFTLGLRATVKVSSASYR